MSLIKLGEATTANIIDSTERLDAIATDPEIIERFKKYADNLKQIAPKAKDFLYFTAVMMHAAEASLLDENGEIKKDSSGRQLSASWEKNGESVRWACSDNSVRPYKNSNGDIFPEEELLKAHKKWIGKPLCLDHKSSSVDFVRGLIVDTFYDKKHKRVIALCALDKVNYPDLARKVSTGYSNNVSMGTGVGRAICTDCGRVARVESDFCDHMRNKSCYGEINYDLNPIELSIVVNGADSKAKIKHIIAKDLSKAADAMSQYLESKSGTISTDEWKSLQSELQSLSARVDKLVVRASADESEADGPTESLETMVEPEMGNETMPPNPPEPIPTWFASASANKLESVINKLEAKITHLQEELNKFSKNEELTMTNKKEAYYQGAGGVNEPTPGQVKYPNKDDQEAIRDREDKQMLGQSPFPGTGPVDGMHPGPASAGESEESRKRRLQRLAEAEERRLTREAALNKVKEAYHQGAGDVNEPTPGKPKYPNKDDYRTTRDKQDKQMTGQPPFPGVGDVDGLHPSPASADQKDELKRKQMLSRAKLSAKFVKAATPTGVPDRGNSRWDVYSSAESGGSQHLILSATVDELTGGKSDLMFESVATKEFGLNLLNRIKTQGFERTAALIKGAQMAPAPAAPVPAAPAPAAAMPPPPPPPMEDEQLDVPEGDGDPEDSIKELANDLSDLTQDASVKASDLEEAVEAMEGDAVALDKVPEAAPAEFEAAAASLESLQSMRKTLNTMLREAMQESATELRASAAELMLAQSVSEKYAGLSAKEKEYYIALVGDAKAAAKRSIADSKQLMGAFVKYAHGTDNLLKRAKAEFTMRKMGQSTMSPADTMDVKPGDTVGESMGGEKNVGLFETDVNRPAFERKLPERQRGSAVPGTTVAPKVDPAARDPKSKGTLLPHPSHKADDGAAADGVSLEVSPDMKVSDLEQLVETNPELDLSTKAGRAEYRAKLAQKGLKFQDLLNQAHPGGGFTTDLDVKPTGDLAKVETLEETHNKMMDIALAPPKVRKQAADIAKLVEAGQISAAEVGDLVSYGVDAEAVKYWKQYYAEAKDSEATDFAKKLVQDSVKQKTAEEQQKSEMKIKRAYDLAYEMRDSQMIEHNQVKDQVEEILKWNDEGFDSMKRVIAKQAMRKQASAVPQVGMLGTGDVILPSFSEERKEGDLVSALSSVFAGRKY